MTKNQTTVMWAGLIILLVYLFTDRNFKNTIFGKTSGNGGSGVTLLDARIGSGKAASNPWGYPGWQPSTQPSNKKANLA